MSDLMSCRRFSHPTALGLGLVFLIPLHNAVQHVTHASAKAVTPPGMIWHLSYSSSARQLVTASFNHAFAGLSGISALGLA
ncbi:hypothetical protein BGW80DRAFT_485194 [Lactifluus volemus]|nr:hypothetical protein BGW80DRAFT_485194 [Lactifluus volemus]